MVGTGRRLPYPNENSSRKRFTAYLDSVATELFLIASGGSLTLVDCTFAGPDGAQHSLGEIIYGIRCSAYHDPNEVDALVHWGNDKEFGVVNGRFVVNQGLLMALFLVLISDDGNKQYIDTTLFSDDHFLTVKGKDYPFPMFAGERKKVFRVLGIPWPPAPQQ